MGRGELQFGTMVPWGPFDLGMARNLTHLSVRTDWAATICIPASMQLQSLELHAPAAHLNLEAIEEWALCLAHLCIISTNLTFGGACQVASWPEQRPAEELVKSLEVVGKAVTLRQGGEDFDFSASRSVRYCLCHHDNGLLL